jgi:hypothetical protein
VNNRNISRPLVEKIAVASAALIFFIGMFQLVIGLFATELFLNPNRSDELRHLTEADWRAVGQSTRALVLATAVPFLLSSILFFIAGTLRN